MKQSHRRQGGRAPHHSLLGFLVSQQMTNKYSGKEVEWQRSRVAEWHSNNSPTTHRHSGGTSPTCTDTKKTAFPAELNFRFQSSPKICWALLVVATYGSACGWVFSA